MIVQDFLPDRKSPRAVLCLGAHSDDLEIGCGGTILKLLQRHRHLRVFWVVFGADGQREVEARSSAEQLLARAERRTILIRGFRNSFFPSAAAEIKESFEELKAVSPDLILTHARHDLHQDHRVVNELTWNTFRNHLILEYEIPKYDGDLGCPNAFVQLDKPIVEKKIRHLMKFFSTQRSKHWFDEETFRGLLRLRGVEAGVRYAEAFYIRKAVF